MLAELDVPHALSRGDEASTSEVTINNLSLRPRADEFPTIVLPPDLAGVPLEAGTRLHGTVLPSYLFRKGQRHLSRNSSFIAAVFTTIARCWLPELQSEGSSRSTTEPPANPIKAPAASSPI